MLHLAERLRLQDLPRGGVCVPRSEGFIPVDAAGLRVGNQRGRVLVGGTLAAVHVSIHPPVHISVMQGLLCHAGVNHALLYHTGVLEDLLYHTGVN